MIRKHLVMILFMPILWLGMPMAMVLAQEAEDPEVTNSDTKPEGTESAPWSQYLGEPPPNPASAPKPTPRVTTKPAPSPAPQTQPETETQVLSANQNPAPQTQTEEATQAYDKQSSSTNDAAKLANLFALVLAVGLVIGVIVRLKNH